MPGVTPDLVTSSRMCNGEKTSFVQTGGPLLFSRNGLLELAAPDTISHEVTSQISQPSDWAGPAGSWGEGVVLWSFVGRSVSLS